MLKRKKKSCASLALILLALAVCQHQSRAGSVFRDPSYIHTYCSLAMATIPSSSSSSSMDMENAAPSSGPNPSGSSSAPLLIYEPLPKVLPRSHVWRGRPRYVDFTVRKLSAAAVAAGNSAGLPVSVTWDRSQPSVELARYHQPLQGPDHRQVGRLMSALADLKANVVVTLGQDRLSEPLAQKHLRIYRDYQVEKARCHKENQVPKTKDNRVHRPTRKRRK